MVSANPARPFCCSAKRVISRYPQLLSSWETETRKQYELYGELPDTCQYRAGVLQPLPFFILITSLHLDPEWGLEQVAAEAKKHNARSLALATFSCPHNKIEEVPFLHLAEKVLGTLDIPVYVYTRH